MLASQIICLFHYANESFLERKSEKKNDVHIMISFFSKCYHAFIGPVTLLCMLVWTITKHLLTNRKWKRILLLIINNSEPLIKKAFSQSMIKRGLQIYWSKTFEWLLGMLPWNHEQLTHVLPPFSLGYMSWLIFYEETRENWFICEWKNNVQYITDLIVHVY